MNNEYEMKNKWYAIIYVFIDIFCIIIYLSLLHYNIY